MIHVPECEIKKDSKDLCLPFLSLKDLSQRDLRRRREQIRARLLDEERIRKKKELKKQRKLKEKEENFRLLKDAENCFWDKEKTIRLPPIACSKHRTFPTEKPYLTLFDTSAYQFPNCNRRETKKKDLLLLRLNARATLEVERDFHPNYDCGVYRSQLKDQMRNRIDLLQETRRQELELEESMIKNYPFGDQKQNYLDRFPKIRLPLERGDLDEKFFPWCTGFGKSRNMRVNLQRKSGWSFEPLICKTKSGYATIEVPRKSGDENKDDQLKRN